MNNIISFNIILIDYSEALIIQLTLPTEKPLSRRVAVKKFREWRDGDGDGLIWEKEEEYQPSKPTREKKLLNRITTQR
jgi:hypothetical protein